MCRQVVKPPPTVVPFGVFTNTGSCEPPKGFFSQKPIS